MVSKKLKKCKLYPFFVFIILFLNNVGLLAQSSLFSNSDLINSLELYLEVILNESKIGILKFNYFNSKLWITSSDLYSIGFKYPQNLELICLNDIKNIEVKFDSYNQSVSILAPVSMLNLDKIKIGANISHKKLNIQNSNGAVFNYDFSILGGEEKVFNSYSELVLFNKNGIFTSDFIGYYNFNKNYQDSNNYFRRLNTSWRSSFPNKNLYFVIGDTQTSSLSLSSPLRIGGFRIGTDYSITPYESISSFQQFSSLVNLPSQVDLYVNGKKDYSTYIPAGEFDLNYQPSFNGLGDAKLIMTDINGKVITENFIFYSDPLLFKKGVFDWSFEAGYLRKNYAIKSFNYLSSPLVTQTLKYGVTNNLTVGSHVELTSKLLNGGFGTNLATLAGTFSSEVAFSKNLKDENKKGVMYNLGYRFIYDNFNFGVFGTKQNGEYSNLSSYFNEQTLERIFNISTGLGFERFGYFGFSYVHNKYSKGDKSRFYSLSWFKVLNNSIYLNLGGYKSFNEDDSKSVAFLTLTIPLGNNTSLSSNINQIYGKNSSQISASHFAFVENEIGWNVSASKPDEYYSGNINYINKYAKFYSGFSSVPNSNNIYGGLAGSLVLMENDLFVSKPIQNGFAVVSTSGFSDIPIKLQNNFMGNSDKNGLFLVSSLKGYEDNLISIDPVNLPVDVKVNQISKNVVIPNNMGTKVNFDIYKVKSAIIELVDANSNYVPAGLTVTLNSQSTIVGFDGIVYFEDLEDENLLTINYSDEECSLIIDYPITSESILKIGPLVCDINFQEDEQAKSKSQDIDIKPMDEKVKESKQQPINQEISKGVYIQVASVVKFDANSAVVKKLLANNYKYTLYNTVISGVNYTKILVGPYENELNYKKSLNDIKINFNEQAYKFII